MIVILLAAGFLAGFAKRGSWVAVLAAAFLPGLLAILGAFDDGEGVATILLASALSATTVAIGVIAQFGVQNLSRRALVA